MRKIEIKNVYEEEATPYEDILDAFRMCLKRYEFKASIVSLLSKIDPNDTLT
jgi:hypothetical protein